MYQIQNHLYAIRDVLKIITQNLNKRNINKRVLPLYGSVLQKGIEVEAQGIPVYVEHVEDYPEFNRYDNLEWCLDMGAQDSFLHFVYADVLITSKSSFSYKPALLNKGIKVCPKNFWHGYPNTEDWIMCNNEGKVEWRQ